MTGFQIDTTDRAVETTLGLLHDLFNDEILRNVGVRLWDGTTWPYDKPRPKTLLLNHPGALPGMLLPGTEVGLGWVLLGVAALILVKDVILK